VITADPYIPTPVSPAEQARRDAEARRLEQEKAAFELEVAAEINRLGPARADEARSLVKMRREALAARPAPKVPATPASCTNEVVSFSETSRGQVSTQTAAGKVVENAQLACFRQTRSAATILSNTCSKDEPLIWERTPPIGDCLACISLEVAKKLGVYPPPLPTYGCVAKVSCQGLKKVCRAPPGGAVVSSQ
jgi:hypothetical protein